VEVNGILMKDDNDYILIK